MATNAKRLAIVAALVVVSASCDRPDPPDRTGDARGDTPATDTRTADGDAEASDTDVQDSNDTADAGANDTDSGATCDAPNCVADRFRADRERNCTGSEDDPARCNADPTTFDDWGPASALTHVEFESERAQNCCFNLDGSEDGSVDNAFGALAADLPIDVDRQVQANLEAGTFVALGEYQGLESLDAPGSLDSINIYLGVFGSRQARDYIRPADPDCNLSTTDCELTTSTGERFLANPTILDEGTHPEVQFTNVSLDGSTLNAGPTELVGRFNVPGLGRHALKVRGATFEADVDLQASNATDGLVVEEGRIGGYVLIRDLIELLNGIVGHCDCLGRPERAVTYPNDDPADPDYTTQACASGSAAEDRCRVECRDSLVDLDRCSQLSNMACGRFPEFCLVVDTLADRADLDTDGDGVPDALSFGAVYEMTGARLDGIADYVRVSDQSANDGTLVVDRVFSNQSGWLAVYEPSGGNLELLGETAIAPGNHVDETVDIGTAGGQKPLMVVPHADDGAREGTFEPDADSQLRYFPNGTRISRSLQLLPD